MRVFVTGGTGLVGHRLVKELMDRGDQVLLLTRRFGVARQLFGTRCDLIEGDPMQAGPWMDAVADCDAVVNLAGENIFNRRWSRAFKTLTYDSRINTTRNIVDALQRKPRRGDGQAKILVNASAVGIYGAHGDEELDETSPAGSDFMAQLCVDWEKETNKATQAGVRVALIRIGIVLDKQGGALSKLLTPFRLFVGGPVGSGRQYMSWIHHDDLVGLILLALDKGDARGPINGTAPHPVTNRQFGKALGRALHRPSFVWTPGIILRIALGEVANVVVKGQRVLPKRALALGYAFRFPTIDQALKDILS